MRSRFHAKTAAGLALLAGFTIACAAPSGVRGRTVETDPACLAPEAPRPATMGAALFEDPPLPGTVRPGWPAPSDLRPPTAPTEADDADMQAEGHHEHAH